MRLLIVEDDADGREMLAELFRMHAWDVTAVTTTEAAMVELREGGFDVVISDEDLEGRSGSSMLREASAAGLLHDIGTIMYTAEPRGLDVPVGCRVLRKPLAIASLLEEANALLPEPQAQATRPPDSGKRVRQRVELTLYTTDSPSSQRAVRDLERVIEETCEEQTCEAPPSRKST